MLAEIARRTIWCIIRIENEYCNNFESYRIRKYIAPLDEEATICASFGKKDLVDQNAWIQIN